MVKEVIGQDGYYSQDETFTNTRIVKLTKNGNRQNADVRKTC